MTPGDHAADDGSFARSAGVHAGRAAILIAAALIIGFLVLDEDTGTRQVATTPRPDATGVTNPEDTTTTTPRVTTTTAGALRPPDQVKVLALNATGTAGVAGRVSDQLRAGRYNVLPPSNATTTARAQARASMVYWTAGYNREALAVAQVLGLTPTSVVALPNPPPAPDLRGANIVVLVKEDLVNRSAPSTTTTKKP